MSDSELAAIRQKKLREIQKRFSAKQSQKNPDRTSGIWQNNASNRRRTLRFPQEIGTRCQTEHHDHLCKPRTAENARRKNERRTNQDLTYQEYWERPNPKPYASGPHAFGLGPVRSLHRPSSPMIVALNNAHDHEPFVLIFAPAWQCGCLLRHSFTVF
jgi:hypothetical protein